MPDAIADAMAQAIANYYANWTNALNATNATERDAAFALADATNKGDESMYCPTGTQRTPGNGTESENSKGNANDYYYSYQASTTGMTDVGSNFDRDCDDKLGGKMNDIINAHRKIMEQVYPGGNHKPSNKHPFCKDPEFVNEYQCAIRVSGAIKQASIVDDDYEFPYDNNCKHGDERDAGNLWQWVVNNSKCSGTYGAYGAKFETEDDFKNFLQKEGVKGRKGFIFIDTDDGAGGRRGVHIDTFDGDKFTDSEWYAKGYRIYFIEIK
jgi:hypothetical protein